MDVKLVLLTFVLLVAALVQADLIWHKDEEPYDPAARCQRSHSFYSNSDTANTTDTIDLPSELDSRLAYQNTSICFYCVCTVDGTEVGCIGRDPWFCQYYRHLRRPMAARDSYRIMFNKDVPTYLRELPWRMRRTMDNGMFDLVEGGGDSLCCDHPSGHRRNLHSLVRNKIRQLRKKIPKENLMSRVSGGDYEDFVVNNDK